MIVQNTSLAAHKWLEETGKSNKYRKRIYEYIKGTEGCTCDEIEQKLSIRHQTASSQIRWLVQNKFLFKSIHERLTRTGRKAIVWKATQQEAQGEFKY